MTLTLRAVSLNDLPLTQPITAHFDLHGGTIGRADHNTMALPDPVRHISRQQAEVIAGLSGYLIKNIGSANPIMVRDQSLGQGESAPLMHSDHVRIGGYLLEVIDESANDSGDATTVTRGRAAADTNPGGRVGSGTGATPAGDLNLNTPLSNSNPFADLLRDKREGSAPVPRPTSTASTTSPTSAARLPDDFDPFAPPAPRPSPSAASSSGVPGAFDDLIPSSAPPSIDEIFGLKSGSGPDPLAEFMAGASSMRPEEPDAAALSTDPLVLFGPAKAKPEAALPPETSPDHVPELRSAFKPPQPVAARDEPRAEAMPAPVAESLLASTRSATSQPLDVSPEAVIATPDVPESSPTAAGSSDTALLTELLLLALNGILQLLAVRSATRHELHAQVTVIRPRDNNPLKFSPDAQSALEQLLQPPLRGFMSGPEAMSDAMNDLVGHAIGTMAGTRAALEGVLGRFSPQELEAKLVGKSMLDNVLPMNRKAKLWDLYLQHHDAIREEAQEDFHALFGKAFLAAYEQQHERLRREKTVAEAGSQ